MIQPTPPRHTFDLPVKYFIDSLTPAYDGTGKPFCAVQCNDHGHAPGCAVFVMDPNGQMREILATGETGWSKPKIAVWRGEGVLWAVDQHGKVNTWLIPEWQVKV